jgi:hypothetical protein
MSSAQCQSFGGVFQGVASTCAAVMCQVAAPMGACCRGGTCTVMNVVLCGGHYLGTGTTCIPTNGTNPCCAADFNNSGTRTVQDLFDFLVAYFAACP